MDNIDIPLAFALDSRWCKQMKAMLKWFLAVASRYQLSHHIRPSSELQPLSLTIPPHPLGVLRLCLYIPGALPKRRVIGADCVRKY